MDMETVFKCIDARIEKRKQDEMDEAYSGGSSYFYTAILNELKALKAELQAKEAEYITQMAKDLAKE